MRLSQKSPLEFVKGVQLLKTPEGGAGGGEAYASSSTGTSNML
jgi:hypothetical protein